MLPPKNDTGDPVVVAAGDIASCFGTGDEATSRLLSNIEGRVLTLATTLAMLLRNTGVPNSSESYTTHTKTLALTVVLAR